MSDKIRSVPKGHVVFGVERDEWHRGWRTLWRTRKCRSNTLLLISIPGDTREWMTFRVNFRLDDDGILAIDNMMTEYAL